MAGRLDKRMQYEIYADQIWLTDFITMFFLYFLVSRSMGHTMHLIRMLFVSALQGVIYLFVLVGQSDSLLLVEVVQILFITLLGLQYVFRFHTGKGLVRAMLYLGGYGLLLGGGMTFVRRMLRGRAAHREGTLEVLLICGLLVLVTELVLRGAKRDFPWQKLYVQVELDVYGEIWERKGFWDSGNSLADPIYGRPVSVMWDKKDPKGERFWSRIPQEKRFLIPYRSMGKSHGLLHAALLPEAYIRGQHPHKIMQVLVAWSDVPLSGRGSCDLILNPRLLECKEE